MEPVRTCVACRARASRSDLLRVVADSSSLVFDERKTMPGRGAWVHATRECVDVAIRRRAFVRALRASGPLDTQTFIQTLTKRLNGMETK